MPLVGSDWGSWGGLVGLLGERLMGASRVLFCALGGGFWGRLATFYVLSNDCSNRKANQVGWQRMLTNRSNKKWESQIHQKRLQKPTGNLHKLKKTKEILRNPEALPGKRAASYLTQPP